MPDSASTPTQPRSTARGHERVPGLAGGDGHDHAAAGRVVALVVGSRRRSWRPRRPCRRSPRRRPRGCCRRPARAPARRPRRTGVRRRPASSSVVARTQARRRTAQPQRRVVARSGAQARRTATGLPSTVSPAQVTRSAMVRSSRQVPSISTSVPPSGTTTGLVNLAPSSAIRPRLAELLVDVARGQGEGEHAVRDHVGEADAAGDLGVLVDRVGVAAGRGVGDQVVAGDGVRRRASSSVITHPPCGRGSPRRCRPARRRRR